MEFLLDELKEAKQELKLAEISFNEADENNIDYAVMRLSVAKEKINLIYKEIKKADSNNLTQN